MSVFVSEASIGRAPAHSQGNSLRPQGGGEEAESPFAELLDGCAVSELEAADGIAKPVDPEAAKVPAEARPAAAQPSLPEKVPVKVDAIGEDISAELMVLLALGDRPAAPEGKEQKSVPGLVPAEPVAEDSQPDTDAQQPRSDAPDQTGTVIVQTVPVQPAPVAAVVAVPLPAEAAAETIPAPESPEIAAAATTDVPARPPVGGPDIEQAPRATEAIETTLTAQADKNKTAQAEKPASAAAEQTLDTPAAFRSAAGTKDASRGDAPKAEAPEQTASAPAREAAAAPKDPQGDSEAPDIKPASASSQPAPEAGSTTATLPAPPHASVQQSAPPVVAAAVANSVPVAGLAVAIAAHAQAGKNRFEIRLDPPELGRIDVRLDVRSDGQVTSHLRVERPETLDLLRRDAPMLERALQEAGLKTSDSGLQFSLRDQSFAWQQQQQGREAPAMARLVVPDETLPAETERHYGRPAGPGSGVDIRV